MQRMPPSPDAPMGTMLPRSCNGITIDHILPNFSKGSIINPLDIMYPKKHGESRIDRLKRQLKEAAVLRARNRLKKSRGGNLDKLREELNAQSAKDGEKEPNEKQVADSGGGGAVTAAAAAVSSKHSENDNVIKVHLFNEWERPLMLIEPLRFVVVRDAFIPKIPMPTKFSRHQFNAGEVPLRQRNDLCEALTPVVKMKTGTRKLTGARPKIDPKLYFDFELIQYRQQRTPKPTAIAPINQNSILHSRTASEMDPSIYTFPRYNNRQQPPKKILPPQPPPTTTESLLDPKAKIVVAEYLEPEPPLMNMPGMGVNLVNYYRKRKLGAKDDDEDEDDEDNEVYEWGKRTEVVDKEPFLGAIKPRQNVTAMECRLFRAPVASQPNQNEFLVFKTSRNRLRLRPVDRMYCVGQQLPMTVVPGPSSKQGAAFVRNFIYATIIRLFWISFDGQKDDERPCVDVQTLTETFPANLDISVRKIMRQLAVLEPTAMTWQLKPSFHLPRKRELANFTSVEDYCANATRLVNEARIKEIEQLRNPLLAQSYDPNTRKRTSLMNAKQKSMPWHTTKAFSDAMEGRCFLTITGEADPFKGKGIGYAFVKHSIKASNASTKKINRAIDTSLRTILSSTTLPDKVESISKTENFIDRVEPSQVTQILKILGCANEELAGLSLLETKEIMRGILKAYEDSKVAAASRALEDAGKKRTSAKSNAKKPILKRTRSVKAYTNFKNAFDHEKDAVFAAQNRFLTDGTLDHKASTTNSARKRNAPQAQEAVAQLRIKRKMPDGERREILVKSSLAIKLYHDIRKKRKMSEISEILGRAAGNGRKRRTICVVPPKPKRPRLSDQEKATAEKKSKKELTMKCGACGAIGHMRTNRACPKYTGRTASAAASRNATSPPPLSTTTAAPSLPHLQQQQQPPSQPPTQQPTVHQSLPPAMTPTQPPPPPNPTTTTTKKPKPPAKRSLSKNVLNILTKDDTKDALHESTESVASTASQKRKSANSIGRTAQKRPKRSSVEVAASNKPTPKTSQTKIRSREYRSDPITTLGIIFEKIILEVKALPEALPFLLPVNTRIFTDYLKVVENPMDLQTMRHKVSQNHYSDRHALLMDFDLMVNNCKIYNGEESEITRNAEYIFNIFCKAIERNERDIMDLESKINPMLHEDDEVALSYVFSRIINEHVIRVDHSNHFRGPVSKTKYPDYYVKIQTPMYIELISQKIRSKIYKTCKDFLDDVCLMYNNSVTYNGADSVLSETAARMVRVTRECIDHTFKDDLYSIFQKQQRKSPDSYNDLAEHLQFESSDEDTETSMQGITL